MPIACACGDHVWERVSNVPNVILVSPQDAALFDGRSWYRDPKGYIRSFKRGKSSAIHRVITGAAAGQLVDHVNHVKVDNRRSNLRLCSDAESIRNRRKFAFSKSQYKGVSFYSRARGKPWVARIVFNGKRTYLGHFNSELDAALAYDAAANALHGQYACPNFKEAC